MRKLEDIDKDLELARQELSNVKGRAAEVYSRIVGYYRSVRNWNKGKREEYGERRLYDVEASTARMENCTAIKMFAPLENDEPHILLFVRKGCPACPGAKSVAGKLGVPVETIDAASEDGFAQAARHNVMSTPTVILFDKDGKELSRAHDVVGIASLNRFLPDTVEYKNAASM